MDAPVAVALAEGTLFFLYTVYRRPVAEEVLRLKRYGERLAVFSALALALLDVLVHAGAAEPGYWFRLATVVLGVVAGAGAVNVAMAAAYTVYRVLAATRDILLLVLRAYPYAMMSLLVAVMQAVPVLYANAIVEGAYSDMAVFSLIIIWASVLAVPAAAIAGFAAAARRHG